MKSLVFLLLAATMLQGCKNLPSPGKYEKKGFGDQVYLLYTGDENHVNENYRGKFAKQDFIIALGQSPSAQYMTADRPRYYSVIGVKAGAKDNLTLMTLEVFERDFRRK